MNIFHKSAVPVVADLVGLIKAGETEPTVIVTTVSGLTADVLITQVMVGAETVKEQVEAPIEKLAEILDTWRLLKAKVVADGVEELSPAP